MRYADSSVSGFTAKAEPGTDAYKTAVAEPTMNAIDKMPKGYRELIHSYGYIDVYRAYMRGWSVERIKSSVKDGRFVL